MLFSLPSMYSVMGMTLLSLLTPKCALSARLKLLKTVMYEALFATSYLVMKWEISFFAFRSLAKATSCLV